MWNREVVNKDIKKQEVQLVVTRQEILHKYVLPKKSCIQIQESYLQKNYFNCFFKHIQL